MRRLSDFIKWYTYITISILIVCAVVFTIYNTKSIPLVTVLSVLKEENRRWLLAVRHVLHYVLLCIIMIICGNFFGWMSLNFQGIAMMVGAVAVVYLLAFGAYCVTDLKQANEINQKLKEKYRED